MSKRLFIAVPIPEDVKERLMNDINLPDNFKKTAKENLHITLLFLGDTNKSLVPQLSSILSNILSSLNAFQLSICRTGQFPPKGEPNIIYVTGDEGQRSLVELAELVRNRLELLDFSDNKKFKYHITVGRLKFSGNDQVILPQLTQEYHFKVDRVILYESILKPDGPEYIELWKGYLQ